MALRSKSKNILPHSETTDLASWGQKTGIAETVRNRANVSDRTIYETATNANEYKGPANARGQAISAKLAGYSGGTDIGLSLSDEQARSAKSAIAALRGSNAAGGATGFDGYRDLVSDYQAVINGQIIRNGQVIGNSVQKGQTHDRPLLGLETSLINGASIGLPSITNGLSSIPIYTYQATSVQWDRGKVGVSGTVFYKTHPNSGLRY